MLFFICFLIPFVGTALGSAAVFCIRSKHSHALTVSLDGLAAGVMTASAIFSLLLPALEGAKTPLAPLLGLLLGFVFFILIEWLADYLTCGARVRFTALAITLHNLPEGMAVGVALAATLSGEGIVTLAGVLMLAIGIAVQNIPEGAIVSCKVYAETKRRFFAFGQGSLSGVIEPIGALLAFALSGVTATFLPFLLSFSASAMLSCVVGELSQSFLGEKGIYGRSFFAFGFVFMSALDVLLS